MQSRYGLLSSLYLPLPEGGAGGRRGVSNQPAYPQITVTPSHSVLANRLIPPTTVSEKTAVSPQARNYGQSPSTESEIRKVLLQA